MSSKLMVKKDKNINIQVLFLIVLHYLLIVAIYFQTTRVWA